MRNQIKLYSYPAPLAVLPLLDITLSGTWDYLRGMEFRTFAAEIVHFVDAIEGGFEPLHGVTEATDVLQIILAAYRSAAEGTIVKL